MSEVKDALRESALRVTFDHETDSTLVGHATNPNGVGADFGVALGDTQAVNLPASAGTVIGSTEAGFKVSGSHAAREPDETLAHYEERAQIGVTLAQILCVKAQGKECPEQKLLEVLEEETLGG
jgi:hypothetical protein